MKKRLIVCSDGTWQSSGEPEERDNVESNVTKMCRAIDEVKPKDAEGKAIEQIVFYQPGVGTNLLNNVASVIAGAQGLGLDEKVIEAYHFICTNYFGKEKETGNGTYTLEDEHSDEIFLFGFSRGAYTVRAIAGLLDEVGIISKTSLKIFPRIYKDYTESFANCADRKFNPANYAELEYKVHPSAVKIKVIGVWDTVGSLGIPDAWFTLPLVRKFWNKRYDFYDTKLLGCVENAFHALSLDEHRRPFSPTLWYLPQSIEGGKEPNLIQCWFPGIHNNIGGGDPEEVDPQQKSSTNLNELSMITFAWMIDLCTPFLCFKAGYLKLLASQHRTGIQAQNPNNLQQNGTKPPRRGWAQGPIQDSFASIMALAGTRIRAPGQYDERNQITHIPSSTSEETGILPQIRRREFIHPSARVRIVNRFNRVGAAGVWARYTDQRALSGFQMKYDEKTADGMCSGINWVKVDERTGVSVTIPEYRIPGIRKEAAEENGGRHWVELSLLEGEECKVELDMVMCPETAYVKLLPPQVVDSLAWKAVVSVGGAVMGFLPERMRWWDGE